MSKRSSRLARREASLTLPQSPEEIALLRDISIRLLLEQYHLFLPVPGRNESSDSPLFFFLQTELLQPPQSRQHLIHASGDGNAYHGHPDRQRIARNCDPLSGTSIDSCHVQSHPSCPESFKFQIRLCPCRNRGNQNNDSSRSFWSSPRSRSPRIQRSRSPSRRSRTRSKSRRSSPHTSLSYRWTAIESNDQPASWMLSRRTKRKILAVDYVDFDVILTEVTTNTGGVSIGTKASVSSPKRRNVRNIGSWLQAWSAYAATVLLADPARGYELIGYQSIVAQASSEYQTSARLKYHRLFRQQVHGRKTGHDQPPPMGSVFHRSHSNLCHLLYM